MKNILLIYKTKTGFTEKYSTWIAEETNCKMISFAKIPTLNLNNYDIIIYGAGLHAGRINGLNKFRKKIVNLIDKKVIVFATGGTPYNEEIVNKIFEENFTKKEQENIRFFYFQSGVNYEKMGLFDKIIMKIYSKILQIKNKKTEVEEGTSKAIATSYDHSSKEYINPMINYLKSLTSGGKIS